MKKILTIIITLLVGAALAMGGMYYMHLKAQPKVDAKGLMERLEESSELTVAKSYYSGTVSTGAVKITMDLDQEVSKYHVIIVEDIIDTGRTLNDVVNLLKARNPLSLKVVTLLDKPSRRKVDFKADVSLFTIPDHFVIGYGLDCGEYYRNLPYIGVLKEEVYS